MTVCLAAIHQQPAFIPLAALYIKAYLVGRRQVPADAVDIAEFTLDTPPDEIARRILLSKPDVIGLSCYVWNITTFMAVVRLVRTQAPETTIVLGGPEVGPVAMSVLDACPDVDVVVKSEGEIPFADLVDALAAGRTLRAVKGICLRDGDAVIENEDAPLLQDVNELPSPHLTLPSDYRGRFVCIETSGAASSGATSASTTRTSPSGTAGSISIVSRRRSHSGSIAMWARSI